MKNATRSVRKSGFTLIEVLVTVVVIGVLAAVVIPAVTNQVGAGDSARVINDLNNVRTGIENFDIAVRSFPGHITDLTIPITTSDTSASGTGAVDAGLGEPFTGGQVALWAGPYIESNIAESVKSTSSSNGAAFSTGFAASLNNRLVRCASITADVCDSLDADAPDYLAVHVSGLTGAQFATLNDLVDGVGDAGTSSTTGKLRGGYGADAFYYVSPIRQ